MNLFYIALGENINIHLQAHFSIYTFLTLSNKIKTINVITDRPGFYSSLKNSVNTVSVSDETLTEWKGPFDFFWRIKIKALEKMCALYKNEPVVYVDTDTFLYNNRIPFSEDLLQGIAFMHEDEGAIANLKSKTEKKMWRQVENKKFGGVTIRPTHSMWNAGIVAVPNKVDNEENRLALSICDQMCEQGITRRLIEQFALSVALQETYTLKPAENFIAHYWSNKEDWNKAISSFLLAENFHDRTTADIVESISGFNFSGLAVKKKTRNTNTRLENLVHKLFPPENISFVKGNL